MPRQLKYDDIPFEKTVFSGKIFMYCSPDWEILFPVVDIIRLLKKNTIISTRNGKGQQNIRTYGSQYSHNVLRDEIKSKEEYTRVFKTVKCAFIFTDISDPIVTNILTVCKTLEVPTICYSSIDKKYHFGKEHLSTPEEVITKMYSLFDLQAAKKLSDLFPEFELLEIDETPRNTTLEKCSEILKKERAGRKKDPNVMMYDPNLVKMKKMERDRMKVSYDDDVEKINKQLTVNVFSRLFNKK